MNAPVAPSAQKPTWTILEVVRWTTGRFERQGIASARLDAELLAARAFHRTRVELYTHFDQPLGEGELADYRGLVERRLAGEPVAYLLGRKEFWSLDLEVGPAVLVPRPDTEALVEQALALLRGRRGRGTPGPRRRRGHRIRARWPWRSSTSGPGTRSWPPTCPPRRSPWRAPTPSGWAWR